MTTTEASKATAHAAAQEITFVHRLVVLNLGLVAVQALSAGLFMSGNTYALSVHRTAAVALLIGALVQAVASVVLWRRRRLPAWVAGVSIVLFAIVFLQLGFGYRRWYWLHVPIGVGLFGGLTRQVDRLTALSRTSRSSTASRFDRTADVDSHAMKPASPV